MNSLLAGSTPAGCFFSRALSGFPGWEIAWLFGCLTVWLSGCLIRWHLILIADSYYRHSNTISISTVTDIICMLCVVCMAIISGIWNVIITSYSDSWFILLLRSDFLYRQVYIYIYIYRYIYILLTFTINILLGCFFPSLILYSI